jgi:hypothetical protein
VASGGAVSLLQARGRCNKYSCLGAADPLLPPAEGDCFCVEFLMRGAHVRASESVEIWDGVVSVRFAYFKPISEARADGRY